MVFNSLFFGFEKVVRNYNLKLATKQDDLLKSLDDYFPLSSLPARPATCVSI